MTERDWAAEARESLARAVEPLRLNLSEIETKIAEVEAERSTLFAARREVKLMLAKLLPPTAAKPSSRRANVTKAMRERAAEKRNGNATLVRNFIDLHAAKYKEGLTAAQVHRDIKAENGDGTIGPGQVKEIVESLHAAGFLRADKKIRGGAMRYKLVEGP
jgi:hypothetical protein